MKKDRWYKRLGKLWMLVGRLIGYVVVASVPIIVIALLSIFAWALLVDPALQAVIENFSIASGQKEYLVYAIRQLADWTWRVILLGAFAALVYEQLKRHEALYSKRDAILTKVRHVRLTRNWKQLDDLHKELTDLGSEAENRELCVEMADAFYERVTDPMAANWELAYPHQSTIGWLETAKKLYPPAEKRKSHKEELTLLLEFSENIKSSDKEKYQKAIKCIQILGRELLMGFLEFHNQNIHFAYVFNKDFKDELDRIIRSKKPEHEDYILYALLGIPRPLDSKELDFLAQRKINKDLFRAGALAGSAEHEPTELTQFDVSEITCSPKTAPKWVPGVIDFVEPALQFKHLIVLGKPGDGKTFLNRQLEHFALKIDPRWIVVNWSAFLPLLEEEQMTVQLILKSFARDLRATLASDQRFRELVRLRRWDDLADWREQILYLKEMLRAKGIEGIFIAIDNLDKYPEFRRENRNLTLLVASVLRPEIVQDAPPCYLRLYIEPSTYSFLNPGNSPWSLMETIDLTWDVEQKKKILQHRERAIRKGEQSIQEVELERLALRAQSLCDLIRQFHASERREYEQYLQESGVPLTT